MKFNWNALDYSKNSDFQFSHAKLMLRRIDFKGNESVLDVGCGDGKITATIAKNLPNGYIIGLDSSKSMINFAKKSFSRIKNLDFKMRLAEKIPYKKKFDLVVSFACLHWVKNQISFLRTAKKSLKNKGRIIITLYPKHHAIWTSITEVTKNQKWKKYFIEYKNPHVSYSKLQYKALSEKTGLKINYLKESTPVAYFNNKKEMGYFLRSWLPHTDQIYYKYRDEFIYDIGERFITKIPLGKNGKIGMPFRRLDIILEKIK